MVRERDEDDDDGDGNARQRDVLMREACISSSAVCNFPISRESLLGSRIEHIFTRLYRHTIAGVLMLGA